MTLIEKETFTIIVSLEHDNNPDSILHTDNNTGPGYYFL